MFSSQKIARKRAAATPLGFTPIFCDENMSFFTAIFSSCEVYFHLLSIYS
jgi:hypothetical protein